MNALGFRPKLSLAHAEPTAAINLDFTPFTRICKTASAAATSAPATNAGPQSGCRARENLAASRF
jgi:hypothetical protein